jgi:hypothetical protein
MEPGFGTSTLGASLDAVVPFSNIFSLSPSPPDRVETGLLGANEGGGPNPGPSADKSFSLCGRGLVLESTGGGALPVETIGVPRARKEALCSGNVSFLI